MYLAYFAQNLEGKLGHTYAHTHFFTSPGCYLGHQDNFLSPPYHIRQFIIKFRKRFFAAAAGLVNSRHWAFASYFSSSGCVGPFSKFARPRGSPSASKLDRDAVNRRQWPYQILARLGDCKLQWEKSNSLSSRLLTVLCIRNLHNKKHTSVLLKCTIIE